VKIERESRDELRRVPENSLLEGFRFQQSVTNEGDTRRVKEIEIYS
jgi:hypothetical protein